MKGTGTGTEEALREGKDGSGGGVEGRGGSTLKGDEGGIGTDVDRHWPHRGGARSEPSSGEGPGTT